MTGHAARAAVRVPRDLAAGIFLVVLALGAWLATTDLAMTEGGGQPGPGLVPRSVALLLGGFGMLVAALGLFDRDTRIAGLAWRGPIFVLGSVVAFAASIRTLGLAFAGPIAVLVSALADREQRLGEIVPYALVLTALCVGLFKYVLRLPIPLAPLVLGY